MSEPLENEIEEELRKKQLKAFQMYMVTSLKNFTLSMKMK